MSYRIAFAALLSLTLCFYLFSSAFLDATKNIWHSFTNAATGARVPDFSHFPPQPRTLSAVEFPINAPGKRVLIVGDLHGMYDPFRALLDKLDYKPASDTLIHVGDIVAKGPHHGSMNVLKYMASHNITGVRGNHDQKVIEWRAWLDWINRTNGGAVWLAELHAAAEEDDPDDPEEWAEKRLKNDRTRWSKKIPDGWKLLSDHYRVARDMSASDFRYISSLPLALHAPQAHVLIAHAGILPSDPNYKPSHRRQPLARIPALPAGLDTPEDKIATLRRLQEAALFTKVPQNTDPWVTLNMRGVLDDNTVTRGKKGTPWAEIWNRDMGNCAGFDPKHRFEARPSKDELPCFPATVVYGHAASRGLDVKRHSVGLDSACVTGHRLSALVVDAKLQNTPPLEVRKKKTIQFGEGSAQIIDVKCD
ncbi:Phosphoric monoester hydrolase [Mycena chlorophos]|uniref:Phosphoric monoester hydrolase n=1 Tax=Mycena chlorophos TaxID=658473 RepID=A0A8H6T3D4_MYCCL|nr:Phosphoric monoester hydrolase [Mycena chlorophos]